MITCLVFAVQLKDLEEKRITLNTPLQYSLTQPYSDLRVASVIFYVLGSEMYVPDKQSTVWLNSERMQKYNVKNVNNKNIRLN